MSVLEMIKLRLREIKLFPRDLTIASCLTYPSSILPQSFHVLRCASN